MAPGDIPAVAALLGTSWRRTYAPLIGAERAAAESDLRHRPEKLERELTRSQVMAFVAENDGNTISGHAMVDIDDHGQAGSNACTSVRRTWAVAQVHFCCTRQSMRSTRSHRWHWSLSGATNARRHSTQSTALSSRGSGTRAAP